MVVVAVVIVVVIVVAVVVAVAIAVAVTVAVTVAAVAVARRASAQVVEQQRRKVLSEAEWRFRMRGYGYNLRRTEGGLEVARLPQNRVLGTLEI